MFHDSNLYAAAKRGDTPTVLAKIREYGIGSQLAYHALMNAAEGGQVELVRLLLDMGIKKDFVDDEDEHLVSRLFLNAAWGGSIEVMRFLIERGADATGLYSFNHLNCMAAAAGGGHPEAILFLVEQGAEVDYPNALGETPLFFAASEGQPATIRTLVTLGADVNHQDKEGNTAIYKAIMCMYSPYPAIKELLKQGATLMHFNTQHISPLRLALKVGRLNGATFLLNNGANLEEKDTEGKTTRQWVQETCSEEVIQWFEQHFKSSK